MLHSAFTAIILRRFRAGQASVAMENSHQPCPGEVSARNGRRWSRSSAPRWI